MFRRFFRPFSSAKGRPGGDLAFALLLVSVVALLIIPLPKELLDVLLTANIAFAVVLVLSALYVTHPLRLSTFPSILLMATLLRLALNVSTTRLILRDAEAGQVIEAFGTFVVAGNFVVGAVIFLILTIIQFLVIAKGSERVAEVAARFTLDAMPGRQMAIDADLRSGALTLEEAQEKRESLQSESHLFGSMDGAMKFVKGDAMAGILITLVNVIGGLFIGMGQLGMSAAEAASVYTLLTVGDGLVSQIPALLVAMSAGLIVTRVSAREGLSTDLGTEIVNQLSREPRVFVIASGLLFLFAMVPGLPFLPFTLLALASGATAHVLLRGQQEETLERAREGESDSEVAHAPSTFPAVTLELGKAVGTAVADQEGESRLRSELAQVREAFFDETGVRLPGVRTRFGRADLDPFHCRVRVWEVPEGSFQVDPGRVLVRASLMRLREVGLMNVMPAEPIPGEGELALIAPADRGRVEELGFEVVELSRRIMWGVIAVIREHRASFIGLAETQLLLDSLEGSHQALVDAVVPRPISLSRLVGILRRLADEEVPIRDLRAILEALAAEAREDQDLIEQVEISRCGLSRHIVYQLSGGGMVPAWFVSADIEEHVRRAIRRDGETPSLALAPSTTEAILSAFRTSLPSGEQRVYLVTSQDVRRYVQQLVRLEYPKAYAFGMRELGDPLPVSALGTVKLSTDVER